MFFQAILTVAEENIYCCAARESKAEYHRHIGEKRQYFSKIEARGSKSIGNDTGPSTDPCGTPPKRGMLVDE